MAATPLRVITNFVSNGQPVKLAAEDGTVRATGTLTKLADGAGAPLPVFEIVFSGGNTGLHYLTAYTTIGYTTEIITWVFNLRNTTEIHYPLEQRDLAPAGIWSGGAASRTLTSLGFALAAADVDAALANKLADHTIRRAAANARASSDGDAPTFRSMLGAISKLCNKLDAVINAGKLTMYQEDDATQFATQTLTTDAAAEPITVVDTD
jgi:hypothetical protein